MTRIKHRDDKNIDDKKMRIPALSSCHQFSCQSPVPSSIVLSWPAGENWERMGFVFMVLSGLYIAPANEPGGRCFCLSHRQFGHLADRAVMTCYLTKAKSTDKSGQTIVKILLRAYSATRSRRADGF